MPPVRSLIRVVFQAAVLVGVAGNVMAHVTIRPAEAPAGAETTYTVRVPTEGPVMTTGVKLIVPEGVAIFSVAGDAGSYEIKSNDGRAIAIVWKTAIPPGQQAEFSFTARNPTGGAEIIWKAFQLYQDGTRAEWVEPKGSKRPAPVTTLRP